MRGLKIGPTVAILSTSGMIRVGIRRSFTWVLLGVSLLVTGVFAEQAYFHWAESPFWLRIIFAWVLASTLVTFIYRTLGEETIEINSRKVAISKGFHGWERRREYEIDHCRELEWSEPSRHDPGGLTCKVRWRRIQFAQGITEDAGMQILAELQQTLPDVAQKICSTPASKDHFVSLGLGR